jgi:hypothetical protein
MDQRNPGRRARQSRHAGGTGPQKSTSPLAPEHDAPDLHAILGRFSDALSMIAVVYRSLSAQESAGAGDEEVALRHAIDELKAVYNELDAAASLIRAAAATHLAVRPRDDYK